MPEPPIRRDGELSEQSLFDAISTERTAGRFVHGLAVAPGLEDVAVQILSPGTSPADAVRSVMARVYVDRRLARGEWELRDVAAFEEGMAAA